MNKQMMETNDIPYKVIQSTIFYQRNLGMTNGNCVL